MQNYSNLVNFYAIHAYICIMLNIFQEKLYESIKYLEVNCIRWVLNFLYYL